MYKTSKKEKLRTTKEIHQKKKNMLYKQLTNAVMFIEFLSSCLTNADMNIELLPCIFNFNHVFSKMLTYEFDSSHVY